MSNMVLGYQNNVMAAAITVSAADPGLGGDQLQNDQGSAATAWQTQGTSGAILLTCGADVTWQLFGLFRTNLTPAAVCTWYVIDGVAGVEVGLSSPVTAGFGQTILMAPLAYTGERMQVNISDPTNPDGFLNIPLMYAGPAFQPVRNYSWDSSPNRIGQVGKSLTRAGGTIIRPDWTKRTFDLSLSAITAGDLPQFQAAELYARQGNNVLFVPNPEASSIGVDAIYGEMESASGFTYPHQSTQARGWRATITERL